MSKEDLNLIFVGNRDNPEYKHNVKWYNLEISDNLYESDVMQIIHNEDGTIKDKYFIKKITKELIYDELQSLLTTIYHLNKNKKELEYEDKIKLRELKTLKKYYERYIDKQNLITSIYIKETAKKMKELNKRNYINKDFNKELVSSVYDKILSDINLQINRIEQKKTKYLIAQIKKDSLKKISNLIQQDYNYQKEVFNDKEFVLKNKIKENKLDNNLKIELQKLQNNFKSKNLQNYTQKAVTFLSDNGISVDRNHK